MKKIEAIDLFCGIGGLTCGLRQARFNGSKIHVLAGLDNDVACQYSYEKNNKAQFIAGDITDYDFTKLKKLYSNDSIRVLVGCAPCQPFSAHSYKYKNNSSDTRWNLINYFIKAVKILNPHVISMENVRGITRTDVFGKFVEDLKKLGYQITDKIVNCSDYGIPQNRSRLVLLGSKLGKIAISQKTHSKENYMTVGDIIKSLPNIKSGETSTYDPVHRCRKLMPINLKRIKQSKPKGTWHDWDESLLPECYKRQSGQTFCSVYGRMSWDSISPTITTQFYAYGSGRFGHPSQHRAISLREGALLQTFPIDYDFGEKITFSTLGRHIGNAVPPKLGKVIGNVVLKHLEETYV